MNIGILTYHRAHNYGALLQAYALKTYLTSLGHDVKFVDYWPEYHREYYALWKDKMFHESSFYGKLKMIAGFCLKGFSTCKRRKTFIDFINQFILAKHGDNDDKSFDVLVYGSDTIWKSFAGYGFDTVYFGEHSIPCKKHIVYSASMLMKDFNEDAKRIFRTNLSIFSAVSVRESTLQKAIQQLTTLEIYHTLDPVFLLTFEDWAKLTAPSAIKEKYIFFYNQQFNRENINNTCRRINAQLKLPVYCLSNDSVFRIFNNGSKTVRLLVSPREFLSLIKNAEFVFSASFHGIAFAIIFRKDFFAYLKEGAERAKSLLKLLGIEDRLITDITRINDEKINYIDVYVKLSSQIDLSKKYLVKALAEA